MAMSETSARVGVGLVIMDSSMLVATITGLPRFLQPWTMRLCQYGTYKAESTQHNWPLFSTMSASMGLEKQKAHNIVSAWTSLCLPI